MLLVLRAVSMSGLPFYIAEDKGFFDRQDVTIRCIHSPDPKRRVVELLADGEVAFYTSISAIVKAELFPTHVRTLGVALPYAVAHAIFGGNAETAALSFKNHGYEAGFFWLVAGLLAIGFVVAALMRDTARQSRISDEQRHAAYPPE